MIALENEAYGMVSVRVPVAVLILLSAFTVYDKVARGVFIETAYNIQ